MKKIIFFSLIILVSQFSQVICAQTKITTKTDPDYFDIKATYAEAKAKNMALGEIDGYVKSLEIDFYSRKALEKQKHKHTPYENSKHVNEQVIYLNGDNRIMSIGCPNAGFENYDFSGWTGAKGIYSGTQASPVYTITPGIFNPAGNNIPLANSSNFHTILSSPPTDPTYPICTGFDSMACPSSGPLISQIPFVSPYSLDGVSCRLLGSFGGGSQGKVSRLKYVMSVNPNNKLFSYSYAIVLNDGHSTDPGTHQPYFKVTVRDQNGNLVLNCQPFFKNATDALTDTSFRTSHLSFGGNAVIYRPWRQSSIDLSSPTHSLITSVSIEFEVAGCSAGGHLGYAYVDAECGAGGIYPSFCGGNDAVLTAPKGYTHYQWYDPSGALIAAPTGTNPVLTISSPQTGNTYSVSMVTPGGCTVTLSKTIAITNVTILNLNSAPSCAGGNSGIASVDATGSTGAYSYTWTNINTGQIVSNSQTAIGLAPGNYSVMVASPPCGQDSYNFSIGTSPPFYLNQSKQFCGNSTFIDQPGGSNYVWYKGQNLISAPEGINDTLYIPLAIAGDQYSVVYKNAQGCKDSIIYSLVQMPGGNPYFTNITNSCANESTGSLLVNVNTPFSPPYNFSITGPTAATTVSNSTTSASSITIDYLAPGTYTMIIDDGFCIYNNTVSVGVVQTNFTVTAPNALICFPEEATLDLKFENITPSSCGLSNNTSCPSQNFIQIGDGTNVNTSTSNPSPYGNYYKNKREQYLFTASELLSAGLVQGDITSLSFQVNSILPLNTTGISSSSTYIGTLPNYSIKMKCSSATMLSNFDSTGLVQVYFGDYTPTIGSNTHNFTQPYAWDGLSSLIVDVCYTRTVALSSTYYTSNPISPNTNTGSTKTVYFVSDDVQACGNPNGVTSMYRPNIRFGNCGVTDPSSYTLSVSPNGTITANFANDSITVAPTFTIAPVGTGSVIYTISATNPIGGCVSTQTVEIIYPSLNTSINVKTDSIVCEGSNTILSATGAGNYNWYSYQNGSLTYIASTDSVTVAPTTIGTNTYIVTGTAPCPGSTKDSVIVTIDVIQIANLIITPLPDVTKCLNKFIVLNADVESTVPGNTGQPYIYSWTTLPTNNPASGVNSTSGYTVTSDTTITLVVTVNGFCSNPISDTVIVNNFIDNLSVSITNSVITCPDKLITLNALINGGYPDYEYYWSANSTTVAGTSSFNFTSPSSGGTYTVGITVIDSCGYEDFDSDIVVVLPNTLNISILDSITACGNTPFTLRSSASGGYSDYSYFWTLDSEIISTSQNLSFATPAAEGTYSVFVTVSDSCGYQKTNVEVINVLTPCMVEIPNVITPNGDNTNEYFTLRNLEYHPNTRVTIFDRWGKKIYENSNYNNEWKAEGLTDGTYFYIVEVSDDKNYTGFVTVFKGQ